MNSSFNQCKPGEKKATYIVKEEQDLRVEDIAWWERKGKKEVIQEALEFYFSSKNNIPVKPRKAA